MRETCETERSRTLFLNLGCRGLAGETVMVAAGQGGSAVLKDARAVLVRRTTCGAYASQALQCDPGPGVAADRALRARRGLLRRKLVFPDSARRDAGAHGAGPAGSRLVLCGDLHCHLGPRRAARLRDR